MCINTIGSYRCTCHFGNILLKDNHSCYGNVAILITYSYQLLRKSSIAFVDTLSFITTDPCSKYSQLDDTSRSIYSHNKSRILSDQNVVNNTWYRFNAVISKMIITNPIEMLQCGTISPGWLTVSHPQSKATSLYLLSLIDSIYAN